MPSSCTLARELWALTMRQRAEEFACHRWRERKGTGRQAHSSRSAGGRHSRAEADKGTIPTPARHALALNPIEAFALATEEKSGEESFRGLTAHAYRRASNADVRPEGRTRVAFCVVYVSAESSVHF